MNAKNSDSGSDLSSNSSWTVIDETQESVDPSSADVKEDLELEIIRTTEVLSISDGNNTVRNEFVKVSISSTSIKSNSSDDGDSETSQKETRSDGFLTFDEYLQERMLEHDYEYPNKNIFKSNLKKSKEFAKGKNRCKAETISVLSLCASILTVTGIALLCLIFPENIDSKNLEMIKNNYQDMVKNDSLDYNNILKSFNKTMEVLDASNNTELFAKCANSYMNSVGQDKRKETYGPSSETKSSRYRLKRLNVNRFSRTGLLKNDMCYPKYRNDVCYPSDDPKFQQEMKRKPFPKFSTTKISTPNSTKSTTPDNQRYANRKSELSAIQNIIGSSSLKGIIKTILHDLCMLKLITYLNNPKPTKSTKQKNRKGGKKASRRILLEAIAEGMSRLHIERARTKKIGSIRRKNKSPKMLPATQTSSPRTLNSTSGPDIASSDRFSFSSLSKTQNSLVPFQFGAKEENGKSECERRFEEIDQHRRKSKEFCSKHRFNIQQIKDRYRTEIDAVKSSDLEPVIRLHRMQAIRENYRLQLKKNRDIYLREMCKMKRLRSKMLRDICGNKKNELEVKDASVGSYVVPINEDFQSRLQKLKQQEVVTYCKSLEHPIKTDIFETTGSAALIQQPSISFSLAQKTPSSSSSRTGNATNLKKLKRKPATDIPSVFGLSFNFQSTLQEKDDKNGALEDPFLVESEDVSPQVNEKKIQGHLYQLAFEKKADAIKKNDELKWQQQQQSQKMDFWERYKKDLRKQDPQKCYKPNVMHYKY